MKRRLIAVAMVAVGAYVAACLFFFVRQRALIYPSEARSPVGTFSEYLPRSGPVIVYFHSNGENGADLERQRAAWAARGAGFYGVEYPGYCGRPGEPSEAALYSESELALQALVTRGVDTSRIVLVGRSLGTGPAVELARRGWGRALVLVTPFTSMGDVAQRAFPFLPARWMLADRYDSLSKAPEVKQRVLIVHGTNDTVFPHEMAVALAARFPHAELVSVDGASHADALDRAWDRVAAFVLTP